MFENNRVSMTAELNRIDDQKNRTDNQKFYLEQIGEFIRCNRKIQGFSQRTLAKAAKVSRQCISKIENAKPESILGIWSSLTKILNVLKITTDELMAYMNYKQKQSNIDVTR